MSTANITIPVDVTNPGQFFACCGLLELADRLWPGAEGWYTDDSFCIRGSDSVKFASLCKSLSNFRVLNTMTAVQTARLELLAKMKKSEREKASGLDDEKKTLESIRREEPILLEGDFAFCINWFCDTLAGGARFKTWAGQQSVLDIAQAMHGGLTSMSELTESTLWSTVRGIGLPFNFDSDLGGQGSALDIGFSFDPLADNAATRIEGSCRPALELLCFVGLQRFRPREVKGENRFVYTPWTVPLTPSVAATVVSQAITPWPAPSYQFRLLYRTKYLKSFLPAQPSQGNHNE